MIAAKENFPRFTSEEYFDWEEQQKYRHEYLDGEVYAMTGGTMFARLCFGRCESDGC